MIVDILKLSGMEMLGFVTPDLKTGAKFCGKNVSGNDKVIDQYFPDKVELVNSAGSLSRKNNRWQLEEKVRKQIYRFATITNSDVVTASNVSLDKGLHNREGAVIQSCYKITRYITDRENLIIAASTTVHKNELFNVLIKYRLCTVMNNWVW